MDYLDDLLEKRSSLDEQLETINDRAAAETRALTEPERESAEDLRKRIGIIDERLSDHVAQAEARRAHQTRMGKLERRRADVPEQRTGSPQQEFTSPGRAFIESEEFRSYPGRGQGRAFEVQDFLGLEQRALITTASLAIPKFVWAPVEPVAPVSPLLEVIGTVSVSSGSVEWVEVGADPVAAIVAEGLAKPEATIAITPKSAALDTIAHWVQITRQAMDDATYIRSLIETKLRRGLLRKVESEVAVALAAATLPTASVAAGGNLLSAIRVGVGTVQAAGYNPNAVVLNPADFAALDIAVMGGTLNGPTMGSNFWGLRPVAVASQPAGTATVGDFATGVVWFDRGVSDVFVTDSHAAFFISNILVILAETSGKAAVPEPGALCECTVAATE